MSEIEDKTAALLSALWVRNRPIIDERLATLDATATAAETGSLQESQCKEGQSTAHKLAGALGMYGYHEGTRVAREIEQMLASDAVDPIRMKALIAELRTSIFPNA